MFDININADSAIAFYDRLLNRLKDISLELDMNKGMLLETFQKNLTDQRNPDGSIYRKLSEKYKKSEAYRLRKRLTPEKPLDTDNYRKSFRPFSQPNKLIIKQFHISSPTHEYGLEIKNAFGKGITIKFPERRVVWISKDKLLAFAERVGKDIIRNATRS